MLTFLYSLCGRQKFLFLAEFKCFEKECPRFQSVKTRVTVPVGIMVNGGNSCGIEAQGVSA